MPATMNQLIKLRDDLCRYCRNLPAVPNEKFVELVHKFDEVMTIAYRDGYQRMRRQALIHNMTQPQVRPNPTTLMARTLLRARMLRGTHDAGEAQTSRVQRGTRQPVDVEPIPIQTVADMRRAFNLQSYEDEELPLPVQRPRRPRRNEPVPEDEEI